MIRLVIGGRRRGARSGSSCQGPIVSASRTTIQPVARHPGRLEDIGAGLVAAGDRHALAVGADAKPAGAAVEDRGEHARRVESRQAQPLDRAVGRHQRAGVAVGQEGVVGDARELVGARRGGTAGRTASGRRWAAPARMTPGQRRLSEETLNDSSFEPKPADARRLEGRRALVTGADSGIGQGIAFELAAHGAAVAINHVGDSSVADAMVEADRGGGRPGARRADATSRRKTTSQRAFAARQGGVRGPRPARQQRWHRAAVRAGRHAARGVAAGHRRQPHRHLPVLARGGADHARRRAARARS